MAVASTLIYHPTVSHFLKFAALTAGRDKLLRTVQYFARFYAWYLFRTNALTASITPFAVLKTQLGLARKLIRVGKFVEHLKAAAVASDVKGGDAFLQFCAVGRQLGYASYLTIDTITVLDTMGVKKWAGAKKMGREAMRGWVAGLTFSALGGTYSMYKLREREAALTKEDGESVVEMKKIERERTALNLQLVSDLCDMTIPMTTLGWTDFDDGIVGLAGLTSSLIGLYTVWKKSA